MAVRSPIVNVMGNAALKAARGLVRDFGEVEHLLVSIKGVGEFVSTADLRAERTLKTELKKARPGYAMLFEESGSEAGSDPRHRWIVDPLDGTTNFLHGIPHFAISIALERDGEIVAGVVYEPVRDEMYWAEKGLGGARPRLCRRRPFRRVLGVRPPALGPCRRHSSGPGSRRLCQRPGGWTRYVGERRCTRRQRPSARAAGRPYQGRDARCAGGALKSPPKFRYCGGARCGNFATVG